MPYMDQNWRKSIKTELRVDAVKLEGVGNIKFEGWAQGTVKSMAKDRITVEFDDGISR